MSTPSEQASRDTHSTGGHVLGTLGYSPSGRTCDLTHSAGAPAGGPVSSGVHPELPSGRLRFHSAGTTSGRRALGLSLLAPDNGPGARGAERGSAWLSGFPPKNGAAVKPSAPAPTPFSLKMSCPFLQFKLKTWESKILMVVLSPGRGGGCEQSVLLRRPLSSHFSPHGGAGGPAAGRRGASGLLDGNQQTEEQGGHRAGAYWSRREAEGESQPWAGSGSDCGLSLSETQRPHLPHSCPSVQCP